MRPPDKRGTRGQPLTALAMVLVCWIGARVVILGDSESQPAFANSTAVQQFKAPSMTAPPRLSGSGNSDGAPQAATGGHPSWPPGALKPSIGPSVSTRQSGPPAAAPMPSALMAPGPAITVPEPAPITPPAPVYRSSPPPARSPQIAAGHQMLWLAALAQISAPEFAQGTAQAPAVTRRSGPGRWSADGWLMVRRGGLSLNLPGGGLQGVNLPSGTYGASQAGAVIRYRLAPSSALRPAVYLRATTALALRRSDELAAGLSLRPLGRLPVAAMIEARLTQTQRGAIIRPAAALVSEFPPLELPLGVRGETYVQAGYVGGRYPTAFVDGQGRLDHRLIRTGRLELRAGAATWGGAQRGAQRLDVGPVATLAVPVGPIGARVSADWRFRIAGRAAPASGPALTLSAGF